MAKSVAVDPGSHTWKVLACKDTKGGLVVTRFGASRAADGAAGLSGLGIPLAGAVCGLAGRDMNLRYTQVPPSPDWQLRSLMDLEIQDIAGQSGGQLSADYNLLPAASGEESDVDTVLMALARDEALDGIAEVVTGARGSVAGYVPNCIALYNAYIRTAPIDDDEQVVCLANIGNETTDIALVRGHDLLFARNLPSGTKVLDDAIAAAFDVSARKAEKLKIDLLDLDPASRGRYASGQAEKVTLAAGGAGSALVSGIQSSVMFCKSQTKVGELQLDKVLLTGGGARLRGVRGMLREALRCPVELFDPFETVDLSALPAADAEQLRALRHEAAVALGLAITELDPEVYSLQILPESVKRRQRFLRRTIFNIGAALVGVALLGMGAVQGQQELAAADKAARSVASQGRQVKRTHRDAEELIEQNRIDQEITAQLAERAIPLHGVLRTMRALHSGDLMPPEMWITSIEAQRTKLGGRGSADKPVVVVRGAVKPISGRDVGDVYRTFSIKFREHELIPSRGVVARVDDQSEEKSTFTITIDFTPPPEPKPEDSGEEGN